IANAECKNEQEKTARSESKRFCSKLGAYVKTLRKLREVLAANFQDIENKVIVRLCRKRLKKITRFFDRSDLPAEKLHINRNKIKNLLYCCDALPASLGDQLQLDTTYLDQLQDAIGNWHDIVFMEALLKKEGFTGSKIVEKLGRRRGRLYANVRALSDNFQKRTISP
ncbi:MAG TPA: CHAD domain-containing protein, partial [Saprospiraceae bacterium]|nr:CHAD domain-containing protein [Saprospiraceae bacterium]